MMGDKNSINTKATTAQTEKQNLTSSH